MVTHMNNQLSLICCTVGRERSVVEKMIRSVVIPEGWTVDLIVVDQNSDGRLRSIESLSRKGLLVRRIGSKPGLSIARNTGLRNSDSDYVGFPDDDCWYFGDTLERVHSIAADSEEVSFVTGRLVDEGGSNCLLPDWPNASVEITLNTMKNTICSATLFCRRHAIDVAGAFDERMGAGAMYGAYEEVDLVRRFLSKKFKGRYYADLRVGHPNLGRLSHDQRCKREYLYARGYGYYMRKHGDHVRAWMRAFPVPLARCVIAYISGRRHYSALHRRRFVGRLEGYLRTEVV